MTDQQMSQDEFAAYIARKIETCYLQSRAPQLVAVSGPDCAGKSTLAVNVSGAAGSFRFDHERNVALNRYFLNSATSSDTKNSRIHGVF